MVYLTSPAPPLPPPPPPPPHIDQQAIYTPLFNQHCVSLCDASWTFFEQLKDTNVDGKSATPLFFLCSIEYLCQDKPNEWDMRTCSPVTPEGDVFLLQKNTNKIPCVAEVNHTVTWKCSDLLGNFYFWLDGLQTSPGTILICTDDWDVVKKRLSSAIF